MTCKQADQRSLNDSLAPRRTFVHGKLLAVLIYTAIGPAVGGALTVMSILAVSLVSYVIDGHGELREISIGLLNALSAISLVLAYGVLFGYVIGGGQAFICGLLLAAVSDKFGKFTYVQSALAAATVAFFFFRPSSSLSRLMRMPVLLHSS